MGKAIAALLFSASVAGPSHAAHDLVREFSLCSGRLSALLEHQWLMQDAGSDRTEALRASMLELLGSVTSPETAVEAMSHRVMAKQAQAALLRRATFSTDPEDAAWARRRAAHQIVACAGLLLS